MAAKEMQMEKIILKLFPDLFAQLFQGNSRSVVGFS